MTSSSQPPDLDRYLARHGFRPQASHSTWLDRDNGQYVIRVVREPEEQTQLICLAPCSACVYQAVFGLGTPGRRDRRGGGSRTVLEASCAGCAAAGGERSGGVGQDGVEGRAGLAADDGADDLGVVGGVAAGQVAAPGTAKPNLAVSKAVLRMPSPLAAHTSVASAAAISSSPSRPRTTRAAAPRPGEHGGQDRDEGNADAPNPA